MWNFINVKVFDETIFRPQWYLTKMSKNLEKKVRACVSILREKVNQSKLSKIVSLDNSGQCPDLDAKFRTFFKVFA